jgi:hypothetical protein
MLSLRLTALPPIFCGLPWFGVFVAWRGVFSPTPTFSSPLSHPPPLKPHPCLQFLFSRLRCQQEVPWQILTGRCLRELCALLVSLVSAHATHASACITCILNAFVPVDAADLSRTQTIRQRSVVVRRRAAQALSDICTVAPGLLRPICQVPHTVFHLKKRTVIY